VIALISDIHGNFVALKEVLKEIDNIGIKEIFCLGDVSGYYLQINECCNELRKREARCVLGNHDWHLISGTNSRSDTANKCLAYQKSIIAEDNLQWIASFPVYHSFNELAMVHGGWNNPIDEYLINPSANYFDNLPGMYFASGHTHKQSLTAHGKKIYCNPGSVGQPRDGDPRSAFAIFDTGAFELKRVEYNIDEICGLMQHAGFSEYYYNRLRTGAEHFINK
jgi:predicted phosphodiesterase